MVPTLNLFQASICSKHMEMRKKECFCKGFLILFLKDTFSCYRTFCSVFSFLTVRKTVDFWNFYSSDVGSKKFDVLLFIMKNKNSLFPSWTHGLKHEVCVGELKF